jgi:hypothetical protein
MKDLGCSLDPDEFEVDQRCGPHSVIPAKAGISLSFQESDKELRFQLSLE